MIKTKIQSKTEYYGGFDYSVTVYYSVTNNIEYLYVISRVFHMNKYKHETKVEIFESHLPEMIDNAIKVNEYHIHEYINQYNMAKRVYNENLPNINKIVKELFSLLA